jgi:hypothetical protein
MFGHHFLAMLQPSSLVAIQQKWAGQIYRGLRILPVGYAFAVTAPQVRQTEAVSKSLDAMA